MDANLRQQILVDQLFENFFKNASTKLVASPWAGLTKLLYKQFPKKTVICTSSLQVIIVIYKLNLQVCL
jgi:hypothetical protein